jgi:hypothetical protein
MILVVAGLNGPAPIAKRSARTPFSIPIVATCFQADVASQPVEARRDARTQSVVSIKRIDTSSVSGLSAPLQYLLVPAIT